MVIYFTLDGPAHSSCNGLLLMISNRYIQSKSGYKSQKGTHSGFVLF